MRSAAPGPPLYQEGDGGHLSLDRVPSFANGTRPNPDSLLRGMADIYCGRAGCPYSLHLNRSAGEYRSAVLRKLLVTNWLSLSTAVKQPALLLIGKAALPTWTVQPHCQMRFPRSMSCQR